MPLHGFALWRAFMLGVQQLLGWPGYLCFNAAGREYSRFACHFDPWSPIFSRRERIEVAISDAALAVAAYGLYQLGRECLVGEAVMIEKGRGRGGTGAPRLAGRGLQRARVFRVFSRGGGEGRGRSAGRAERGT